MLFSGGCVWHWGGGAPLNSDDIGHQVAMTPFGFPVVPDVKKVYANVFLGRFHHGDVLLGFHCRHICLFSGDF